MDNELAVVGGGAVAVQHGGGGGVMPIGNASTMVAQSREVALAIASMQCARAFPRDVMRSRAKILNACTRPKLAEGACYSYTRGGTEVTGPSIRLAEMLAQNWDHIDFGIRELEQRDGESTCEAYAWDMETNVRQTKVFQVKHIRHTKAGDKPLTDPRDIYELVANNGARRLRACILGVIPGDIVEEAVEACDATLKANFSVTPDRLKGLLARFAEFGVTKEQVEARIQCHIAAMRPAQMVNLGKIYNSIKDGMSKAEDWFAKPTADEAKGGKAVLAAALGATGATGVGAPAPKRAQKPDGDADVDEVI